MRAPFALSAIAIVMAAVACSNDERSFSIPSSAMEPTLHCAKPGAGCTADENDRIRVRMDDSLERADIVVFDTPPEVATVCGGGGTFVKRIVGLPGETWSQKKGFVYIDGRRLREPYIEEERRDVETFPTQRIPSETYLVLGDNRSSSCDSRRWGFLPARSIIGRVVEIIRDDETIELP